MQLRRVLCCTYVIFRTIFKIKQELYIAAGRASPPPPGTILGAHLLQHHCQNLKSRRYARVAYMTFFVLGHRPKRTEILRFNPARPSIIGREPEVLYTLSTEPDLCPTSFHSSLNDTLQSALSCD
jgi:hypothetical protein